MCLLHYQLVLRWNDITHGLTNGIRVKVLSSSYYKCHCDGEIAGGTTIWLPTTTLKTC